MINRKERKIQRALGTEDGMPPTIGHRIKWRLRSHVTMYTNTFWQWFAFKLPKKLVYHCTIRAWAHAITCPDGRNEVIHDTTVENAIKRWEKE